MPNTLTVTALRTASTKAVQFKHPVSGQWTTGTPTANPNEYQIVWTGLPGNSYSGIQCRLEGSSPEIGHTFSAARVVLNAKLGTPGGGTAVAGAAGILNITGNPVSGAAGYQLYTNTAGTGNFSKVGGILPSPSYAHTGLGFSDRRYYQWQAVGDTYTPESGLSNAFTGITSAAPATVLEAPTNTQATGASSASLNVTANSVANASSYKLFFATSSTGTYTQIGGTLATPSYTHTGLNPETTYYYQWQAVGNGTSFTDSPLTGVFSGLTLAATATAEKFTLAYYQAGPAQTYPELTRRTKPTTWESSKQFQINTATSLIENRNFDNQNSGDAALVISVVSGLTTNITIRNCNFTGWSPSCLLRIYDVNVNSSITIENCGFFGYQTPAGKSGYPGKGLDVMPNVAGVVTIRNNYFENMQGLLIDHRPNTIKAGATLPNLLTIQGNYIHNVQKLDQDGNTNQFGNGYQLVGCVEIVADIRYNYIFNNVGQCTQQDGINLHGTSGRADRRLRIQGNMQRGIYIHPTTTNSTGSSITMDNDNSDSTGVNDPHYVDVWENYTAGSTFGGFNGAGGYLNDFQRNVAVNTGRLPDNSAANGSYCQGMNIYNYLNRSATYYRNNTASGNLLGVFNAGGAANGRNDHGAGVTAAQQLFFPNAFITRANELNMYHFWRKDAQDAGVTVGLLS